MLDLSVISGRIVDERGFPVRRAVVGARSRDDMSVARTNEHGRFALSIVATEPVRVLARKRGHVMAIDPKVAPGADDVCLRLERGAELSGRIIGERGWRLDVRRWEGHERVAATGASVLRRPNGRFSVTRLISGVYEIRVSVAGHPVDNVVVDVDPGEVIDDLTLSV